MAAEASRSSQVAARKKHGPLRPKAKLGIISGAWLFTRRRYTNARTPANETLRFPPLRVRLKAGEAWVCWSFPKLPEF